jgi:ketosteroid isomerase-like protein
MQRLIHLTVLLYAIALEAFCAATPARESGGATTDALLKELVALERSALDRWIALDPEGYLSLDAPDITYFDPTTEKRIDGLDAMRKRLAPIRDMKLPFTKPRYDMLEPKVQHQGDMAVLTFNLVNYGTPPDGRERVYARWNSTEVYSRIAGSWKIVHTHWSYIRPEIKPS